MALCLMVVSIQAEDIRISEFMLSNASTLLDEDGDASDWIELHNTGSESVDLQGWGLTDNHKDLFKWVFPAMEIPADGYLVVFASGKNRRNTKSNLHTNFKISSEEELILTRPNHERASVFSPLPAMYRDISYGVLPSQELGWFDKPTPGSGNGQGYTDVSPEVIPSLPAGLYFDTIEVSLGSDTITGSIRYTLDGSVPNEKSPIYTTPLQINKTTLLKCRTYTQGQLAGNISTFVYMIGNPELKSVTSDLPLII
ncbi:MAG: lamin tail domain-containing protein, partial [Verrucomicrobia bacterium]|nr:lamin tail domain-containing protein [Verrucomicrobiota bacterium]